MGKTDEDMGVYHLVLYAVLVFLFVALVYGLGQWVVGIVNQVLATIGM